MSDSLNDNYEIKVKSHLSTLEIPIIKNQVHFTYVFEKMRMYL